MMRIQPESVTGGDYNPYDSAKTYKRKGPICVRFGIVGFFEVGCKPRLTASELLA